jgi:hypothetical protein
MKLFTKEELPVYEYSGRINLLYGMGEQYTAKRVYYNSED